MSARITPTTGPAYARLLGIGGAIGNRIVTNEEMCTIIDSSDEWIRQRTGIAERRWVDQDQTPLSMAIEAATKAIDRSGVDRALIDTVIVATVSHYRQFPSLAVELADALGLDHPAATDISSACAGFCYAIGMADAMVRCGTAKHVLIVGVEELTKMTNFTDRGTAFLFGDGAGAAVIGPSETPAIGPTVWGSRGEGAPVIWMEWWNEAVDQQIKPVIHMEGNRVFKWAITEIAQKCVEAVEAAGITPADLDVFIPHQANNRITDAMLRRLGLPDSVKVARTIQYLGNTSAASIPLAMEEMLSNGEAHSGDLALIIGFGAGLVYAGQVVVLP